MNFKLLSRNPLLDIRSKSEFSKGHIKNSANIPANQLVDRIHELPENSYPLSLLGTKQDVTDAALFLESKGYAIDLRQIADIAFTDEMKESSYIIKGRYSKNLWKPAPVVEFFEQKYAQNCRDKIGLDLACGSGRDSVFFALNGWSMTSVDHSFSAIDRMKRLAKVNDCNIKDIQVDIEHDFEQILDLKKQYSAIIVVRYLHRPMLDYLRSLIAPKGFIIYQTFLKGCEKFGSPKNPRFLLDEGELSRRFNGFNILLDEINYLSDGRPTNSFIAQKVDEC